MTKNMLDLLKTIVYDKGAIVNKIIKGQVFTADEIVDFAFETNDKEIIGAVAAHIKGISAQKIEKLTNYIVNSAKDPMLATIFATYNDDAPINILENFVIKCKDPEAILTFAQQVEDAEILTLTQTIIEINDPKYIYLFIKDIKSAPTEKLVDALIETKDAKRIYESALHIKTNERADNCFINLNLLKKLEKGIIETKDAEYIYKFAYSIFSTDDLEKAIIETKNIKFIEYYAENVKGASKKKLFMAIERIYVLKANVNIRMELLFNAVFNGSTDKISAASDIYRELFLDETLDGNLVENAKKKILKP